MGVTRDRGRRNERGEKGGFREIALLSSRLEFEKKSHTYFIYGSKKTQAHALAHMSCISYPHRVQSSERCHTHGAFPMVKLWWYVPVLANLCPFCLWGLFPKMFAGQLSPQNYSEEENHLREQSRICFEKQRSQSVEGCLRRHKRRHMRPSFTDVCWWSDASLVVLWLGSGAVTATFWVQFSSGNYFWVAVAMLVE